MKIGEFEVSVLKLKGKGNYAYRCEECGKPLKYRSPGKRRTGLCQSCKGRRQIQILNEKRLHNMLDKEFLMKGVCPKCHKKGSVHKRWVTNGVTNKRYIAYYFGHYDPEKQNVKWCYIPKKTALLYLTQSNG